MELPAPVGETDGNRKKHDISHVMKQEPVPVSPYLCRRYKQYNYEQLKDYYNQESFQEVGREDS